MPSRAKVDAETARRVLACFDVPSDKLETLFPAGKRNFLSKLSNKIVRSPYGIVYDWRGCFDTEFLDPLCKLAPRLGVKLAYRYLDPPRDLAELDIATADGASKTVLEYDPSRDTVFIEGIKRLESATGQRLVFRLLAQDHPSDTLCVAVLPAERWEQVKQAAGPAFHDIFFVRRSEYEPTIGAPMDVVRAVLDSLEAGKKIEAIHHYKKHSGIGAFEAKAEVERIAGLRSMIESLMF
ncbi:MAG: hypothetical protein U0793_20435 [Gemmataceae bacterium]